MDVNFRSQRGSRDTTPDRARFNQKLKPSTKVQVVYYLSRNGLLEHPHFMEVTLLPNQPLRLKDVFHRLMTLRGSGMPLQYSWSSKRNYKSGYVWYDLALKDIIHPAEGGEYVLKGSELVEGCPGRFNVRNKQGISDEGEADANYNYEARSKGYGVWKKQREEEYEEGEKTSSTMTHSGCSRGVSREDEDEKKVVGGERGKKNCGGGEKVKRRDGDGYGGSVSSRYSALLQLIACGSTGAELKGKQGPRLSDVGTKDKALFWEEGQSEIVSENPRLLGNLQDKEYFSGSLVESMKANANANANGVREPLPKLNKSNSYNEQMSSRLGMEEVMEEEEKRVGMKDKCIPLMKSPKQNSGRISK